MEATVTSLLATSLFALVVSLAAFAAAKVYEALKLLKSKVAVSTWDAMLTVADAAVRDAQQSALVGLIVNEGAAKKDWAIKTVLGELAKQGIKIDEKTASTAIEAAYVEFKTRFGALLSGGDLR